MGLPGNGEKGRKRAKEADFARFPAREATCDTPLKPPFVTPPLQQPKAKEAPRKSRPQALKTGYGVFRELWLHGNPAGSHRNLLLAAGSKGPTSHGFSKRSGFGNCSSSRLEGPAQSFPWLSSADFLNSCFSGSFFPFPDLRFAGRCLLSSAHHCMRCAYRQKCKVRWEDKSWRAFLGKT